MHEIVSSSSSSDESNTASASPLFLVREPGDLLLHTSGEVHQSSFWQRKQQQGNGRKKKQRQPMASEAKVSGHVGHAFMSLAYYVHK